VLNNIPELDSRAPGPDPPFLLCASFCVEFLQFLLMDENPLFIALFSELLCVCKSYLKPLPFELAKDKSISPKLTDGGKKLENAS